MTAVMLPAPGAAAQCTRRGRSAPPRGVVPTTRPGAILNSVLLTRWILRVGCTALLGAALMLPELVAGLVSGAPGESGCHCANRACCSLASASACPLSRSGKGCARSHAPKGPGLRAGCDCSTGGEASTLTRQEPALPPGRLPSLETLHLGNGRLHVVLFALSAILHTPDPPPPRTALRSA